MDSNPNFRRRVKRAWPLERDEKFEARTRHYKWFLSNTPPPRVVRHPQIFPTTTTTSPGLCQPDTVTFEGRELSATSVLVFPVEIGTPPKKFSMLLDCGSNKLSTISHFYNPTASTTSKLINK